MNEQVYRVFKDTKGVTVACACFVGRKGSWFEYENRHGYRWKENGRNWADTVAGAIEYFIRSMCYRLTIKSFADHHKEYTDLIVACIDEAIEWGELFGEVNALSKFSDKKTQ